MSSLLIVDDDLQQAQWLSDQLGELGYDGVVLQPQEDVFERLSAQPFQLLLVALKESTTALLSQWQDHLQGIPVVALLANANPDESLITACLQAGAVDYLPSPVGSPLLQARVATILRSGPLFQQLEEKNKDLAQANYLLEGQRSQLEVTLQRLRDSQDEQVERAKMAALADLVAGVAHEINTPLGNTLTTISHLQECSTDAERAFREGKLKRSQLTVFLETCTHGHEVSLRSLERTVGLIESFKRVSVDPSCEELRSVYLKSYIEEVVSSYSSRLKDLGHTVSVQGPEDLEFDSYPGLLAQIFGHLLSNSMTHGYQPGEYGRLSFTLSKMDGGVRIRYSDDGRGIQKQHLSRVFDPFFTTLRGGGSGLGLHITYNLVAHALGGKIRCWSEIDKGSTFLIDLPWLETPEK